MITETILNKFRNNVQLINETIHLGNNTKSVKVITHKDLDGVCSAITIVDQLKKQNVKNIQIEFANYSDKDLEKDMNPTNYKQKTIMTDFARVPTVKIWPLITALFNKEQFATSGKTKIVKIINDNIEAFPRMTQEQFVKLLKDNLYNLNGLKLGENPRTDLNGNPIASVGWKQGTAKKYGRQLNELLRALKAYSNRLKKDNPKNPNEKKTEKITVDNIENYIVPLADVDITMDHHGTEEDGLVSGRNGEIGIESPSECSDAVRKYNPSSWTKEDLEAIDMIDSAGYTPSELIKSASLEKNFTGPGRKRNLAIIINSVIGQCINNNEPATKWLVLNTPPSLVALYNNIKKAYKFNDTQLKLLDALKNGNSEEIKKLSAELPKELQNKWWSKGYGTGNEKQIKDVKRMATYDNIKNKSEKEFEKVTSGRKTPEELEELSVLKSKRNKTPEEKARQEELEAKEGNFDSKDNFSIQNGNAGRFTGALISFNGRRNPFSAKKFSMGLVQVSRSPMYAGEVDFFKVAPHVMEDVENYMRSIGMDEKQIKEVMQEMKEKSGGHETIYNLQGFDKIKKEKKSSFNDSKTLKKAEELAEKKFGTGKEHLKERNDFIKSMIPNAKSKVVEDKKTDGVNLKDKVQQAAIDSFIKWTNKLYPVDESKFKPEIKNSDPKFEVKK